LKKKTYIQFDGGGRKGDKNEGKGEKKNKKRIKKSGG